MKTQNNRSEFKSFEQLKAEIFPGLAEEERRRSSNFDSSQIGAFLADEAIEELFAEKGKKNA